MAIKPPKQFCGKEHWSGEACKECEGIRARARGSAEDADIVSRIPLAPKPATCRCSEHEHTIHDLTLQVAALQAQVDEHNTKSERERQATLDRVRKYRERKAGEK